MRGSIGRRGNFGLIALVAVVATIAAFFVADAFAGSTITVCSSGCDYTTIQSAVNASASGDTISVAAGTYTAGFTVSGKSNLTINGAGASSTIISPTTLISTGVTHKYTTNVSASVFVNNSTNITVENMKITDNGSAPGSGGPDAIVFWNASTGTLQNDTIAATYTINGIQTGQGVAVDGSSGTVSLAVDSTAISGFQKNGIDVIDGNGATSGATDTTTLTVTGGRITGAGNTGTIAQNGIVLWNRGGGTVTATVDGTAFSSFGYSSSSNYATGVLAYGGGKLTSIKNSSFTGFTGSSQYAYYLATASGSPGIDATTGNTFGGVSPASATFAQLGTIQDGLLDKVSDSTNSSAVIRILNNTVIVSPNNTQGIQGSVNAASSGDTVDIAPGTYTGQLAITKIVSLVGDGTGTTTVKAPSTLATSNGYKPVIGASGATLNVSDLTVDCNSVGDSNSGLVGILRYNADGTDNTVNIVHCKDTTSTGSQEGVADLNVNADGTARTWTVKNSTASDYQKGGFVAKKSGLTADFSNDSATGLGPTTGAASNGFEIAFGAGGSVSGCTSKNNYWTGTYGGSNNPTSASNADAAAGVILYKTASGVTVSNCTLTGNQFGVYITESAGVTISGSTITGAADQGSAFVTGVAAFNSQYGDPSAATGVTLTNNVFTNVDWPVIAVDLASGNDVTVTGHGNQLSSRSPGAGAFNGGSNTLDLTGNWWGSAASPGTISGVTTTPYCMDSGCSHQSNEDNLLSLSLSGVSYLPSFSSSTTSYSATVGNDVSSTSVSYTSSPGSTVQVGNTSFSVGSNYVTVKVTSADSTANKTYAVGVTREAAPSPPTTTMTTTTTTTTTSTSTPAPNQAQTAPATPGNSGSVAVVVAPASGSGSPSTTSQVSVTVNWDPGTFTQPVDVKVTPQPAPTSTGGGSTPPPTNGGFAVGAGAVQLNVTTASDIAVTQFAKPIVIHLSSVTPGYQPAYSHDGSAWTFIPRLSSPQLPAGQQDGYYVNSDGSIDIYTLHATIFGVVKDVEAPTAVKHLFARVSKGRVRLNWTGSHDNVAFGRYVVHRGRAGITAVHTTHAVIPLFPGAYYILAVDTSGNVSAPSPTIKVMRIHGKYAVLVHQ